MEFLKGLREAQSLGLTKDEFLSIWKVESQLAIQTQEEATRSNGNNTPTTFQNEQLYNELKQEYSRHFQYIRNHLATQEQRWEQLHVKLDQMMATVKFGYELVNNLVKNMTDANTHSLEVLFRQERELLKHEFINHISRVSHQVTSIIACQHAGAGTIQHTEPATIQNGTSPSIAYNISTAHTDTNNSSKCGHGNIPFEAENNCKKNSVPLLHHQETGPHELSVKTLSLSQQDIPGQDIHSVSRTLEKDGQKPVKENSYAHTVMLSKTADTPGAGGNSQVSDESVATSCDPVVATGPYAEAISKQIKQNHSSQFSSVSAGSTVKSSNLSKNTTQGKPSVNDNSQFTIYNCKEFSVSDKPFISNVMYSTNTPCKAQVCVTFKKTGVLAVHIRIQKGIYDDILKWPLWVSGSGCVSNTTCKYPSKLWQLKPVLCEKPEISEKEQVFTEDVCLITSCVDYPDVTYQQLEKKHFTDGNMLTFHWVLRASEDLMYL